MSIQSSRSRLTALGCLVLAVGLLLPPGASAQPTLRPTPILDAARAAATRKAAAMKTAAGQPDVATTTNLREGSFFKSKAGIATLLIFGGGVAYALYSSSNDRIRSTGR